MGARAIAKHISKKLGLYDHIGLARDMRSPERAIFRRNERDERHLAAILAAILRADSSAIDVGAHTGTVLSDIVRFAPLGHHIAFEPIPSLAQQLALENPRVEVHAAAASDRSGTAQFLWIESCPALSGFHLRNGSTLKPTSIEVRLERLDDVVRVAPVFIKIDVEGAEEAVLRGAQTTLERYRPLVAFEHGTPTAEVFGTTPEAIYDLLTSPGLRVFDMDGVGPFSRAEFVEVVRLGDRFNFLAC